MKIPSGEGFGNVIAEPAPRQQAPGPDAYGAGIGRALQGIGLDGMRQQREEEQRAVRAKAANSSLDHEIAVKTREQQFREGLRTGEIDFREAAGKWQTELTDVTPPKDNAVPPDVAADLDRAVKRTGFEATQRVSGAIEAATRGDYQRQFGEALDKFGKLAGLPNADITDINTRGGEMLTALGTQSGLTADRVAEVVQNFKDRNWTNDATQRAMVARSDMEGLRKLERDLTAGDGFYAGKLDTDKRNAVLNTVLSHRQQLENRMQHLADKREAAADRALTKASTQIEAGVPLSADAWLGLRQQVQGTSAAGSFNDLVAAERETQKMLRLPIEQQEQYVQQRESQLMQQGGTMADLANVKRVKATVEANKKSLEGEPLVAAQRLFGRATQPIQFENLLQPGGPASAAAIFDDRASTLQAMRRQFGDRVALKPLLPQESQLLIKALDNAGPIESANVFGAMRAAINDDEVYAAAMRQIAPDSPVKAHAGMLAALGKNVTTESNIIASDVVTNTRKISQTMLAGEQILNRSRADKSSEGKAQSLFVPGRQDFADSFVSRAGDLYRGRPAAQEADLQAAFAYYVGKAAQTGRLARDSKDIDSSLVKESISATLGDVVNVNGHGSVKAPIGMPSDRFTNQGRETFSEMVRTEGLPASTADHYSDYGLLNYRRDGQYVLTLGGLPVVSPKTGRPLVMDLAPPSIITGSRYRSAVDLIPREPALVKGPQ
jgi:hypothetical protein